MSSGRARSARYRLWSEWRVIAEVQPVYDKIRDSTGWPAWWRGIVSVEEGEPGGAGGLDDVRRYTWRSAIPYRIRFDVRTTRIEPRSLLEGSVTGDLEGAGAWRFSSDGCSTLVTFEWNVRTTKPWMNFVAFAARPLFRWNHDVLMRRGAVGLAGALGARLVSCRSGVRRAPEV